jgi:hypothetical protein
VGDPRTATGSDRFHGAMRRCGSAARSGPDSAAGAEEAAQQLTGRLGQHAGSELDAMIEARILHDAAERAAHAGLGSAAAKTRRRTFASTIAPAHMAHGSSVTYMVASSRRELPSRAAARRSATISACAVGSSRSASGCALRRSAPVAARDAAHGHFGDRRAAHGELECTLHPQRVRGLRGVAPAATSDGRDGDRSRAVLGGGAQRRITLVTRPG